MNKEKREGRSERGEGRAGVNRYSILLGWQSVRVCATVHCVAVHCNVMHCTQ